MFNRGKFKFLVFIFAMIFALTGCQEISNELLKEENLKKVGQAIESYIDESSKEADTSSDNPDKENDQIEESNETTAPTGSVTEGQAYYSKDDVANYLIEFGELPPNYLTKNEARNRGWHASKGNLWDVTDHGVIGGDKFGNFEGLLPKKSGRQYYEADVNYEGGRRNAHRLVFSNDGLIFYTSDHYNSFEEIVGE